MKNSQFKISIITKQGKIQSFRKKGDLWEQSSSKGIVRSATAEQVLSHILPLLTSNNKRQLTLEVKYHKRK
jgi:hypothetical protein